LCKLQSGRLKEKRQKTLKAFPKWKTLFQRQNKNKSFVIVNVFKDFFEKLRQTRIEGFGKLRSGKKWRITDTRPWLMELRVQGGGEEEVRGGGGFFCLPLGLQRSHFDLEETTKRGGG
jgi:hypothetical protein